MIDETVVINLIKAGSRSVQEKVKHKTGNYAESCQQLQECKSDKLVYFVY